MSTNFRDTTYSGDYKIPGEIAGKIPGYGGHCHGVNFKFGMTFSEASRRTLEELRNSANNSSCHHMPHFSLGISPSQPAKFHSAPNYRLNNSANERTEHINYHQRAQLHRHQYKDVTGMVYPLEEFNLPKTANQEYNERHKTDKKDEQIPKENLTDSRPQSSALERTIRDVFFEKR